MFKHKGGDVVKGGFYWNQANWHLENVEGKAGTLPGDADTRYARVPTLLLEDGTVLTEALLILSFLVVTIGGIVQIVPLFYLENTIEKVEGVRP